MPLPEQIIDKLSREPAQTPGWSSNLLMFSGTIFLIGMAVYIGVVFGYKPYLQKQVANLDNQIRTFSQQISPDEQNKLVSFYSQVVNLQGILGRHVVSSQMFEWLEKNTEGNIYYTKLNLLTPSSQLNLTGVSKTADDFSKQMIIFQNDPSVKRIAINNFSVATNNLWQFDISLFLTDNLLNQSGVQK